MSIKRLENFLANMCYIGHPEAFERFLLHPRDVEERVDCIVLWVGDFLNSVGSYLTDLKNIKPNEVASTFKLMAEIHYHHQPFRWIVLREGEATPTQMGMDVAVLSHFDRNRGYEMGKTGGWDAIFTRFLQIHALAEFVPLEQDVGVLTEAGYRDEYIKMFQNQNQYYNDHCRPVESVRRKYLNEKELIEDYPSWWI